MKTILVMEDEPDFQKLFKLILEGASYRVLVAADTVKGWSLLLQERPDMLLLDLNLADGDSLPLCDKIRREESLKHLPVIIITVRSKPENIVLGLQSGADDYISKPFAPEELLTRIEILFRRIESGLEPQ